VLGGVLGQFMLVLNTLSTYALNTSDTVNKQKTPLSPNSNATARNNKELFDMADILSGPSI